MSDPVRDAMTAGFQALLHGDTKERDRQVDRARKIMDAQTTVPKVDIGPKEIVAKLLHLAEHEAGRPLTAIERITIEHNPGALMKRLLASGYKMPSGVA